MRQGETNRMEELRQFLNANQGIIIALVIVAVIVTILFLPFKIKAISGYDVLGNSGYIMLYLWRIKIFGAELGLTISGVDIKTNKKKMSQKFNNFGANGFIDGFIVKLLKALKLKKLEFFANLGVKDAAKTAILCSCISIPMGVVSSQIMNHNPYAHVTNAVYPDFCDNSLKFALHFKLHITLFDVVMSAIGALIKKFKPRPA